MSIELIQPEYMKCHNCGFEGETTESDCPKCRKSMLPSQGLRVAGGFIAFCGAALIVIMLYVLRYMNNALTVDPRSGAITKWNADPGETLAFRVIVYLVMAVGLSAVVAGMWHVVTGRRNKTVIYAMFAVITALVVISGILYNYYN